MDRLLREGNPPAGQLASPKPQYKKPGVDEYAPVEGQHGAPFAILKDASGNVVSPATDAKLEQVKSELELIKSELATIKANQLSGDQKVQLKGRTVEIGGVNYDFDPPRTLYGPAASRPSASDAHAAVPYAVYVSVDTKAIEQTDGTNWQRWGVA